MSDKPLKFAGLWEPKGSSKVVASGPLELDKFKEVLAQMKAGKDSMPKLRLIVFQNDKGDNPKRPDFNLCLAVERERE